MCMLGEGVWFVVHSDVCIRVNMCVCGKGRRKFVDSSELASVFACVHVWH